MTSHYNFIRADEIDAPCKRNKSRKFGVSGMLFFFSVFNDMNFSRMTPDFAP